MRLGKWEAVAQSVASDVKERITVPVSDDDKRAQRIRRAGWMARKAARVLMDVLRERQVLETDEPYLAMAPRRLTQQYGLSLLSSEDPADVEAWTQELSAEVAALVYQIQMTLRREPGPSAAGGFRVRALAPVPMPRRADTLTPGTPTEIPAGPYDIVERIISDRLGIAITVTAMPADEALTLWVGWV